MPGHELVDAAIAIRNVLAHRSERSVRNLNEKVAAFATFPELHKPKVSRDGIGAYLRARTSAAEARLSVYARELGRVARVLAP